MRKNFLLILICLLVLSGVSIAQKVTFSPIQREEDVNIKFDILGRVDSNYLVYKNIRWKHILTFYDRNMRVVSSERMKFLPEKTINADFILYPGYFYVIYQYEKNGIVYCCAAKMNNTGERMSESVILDTTRISLIADNKIYSSIYSEDKQRILIYKMHVKSGKLTIGTRLFDSQLQLLDSNRTVYSFNEREEFFSDFLLANDGTIYFARNKRNSRSDNFSALEICVRKPGEAGYQPVDIPLENKFIDEVFLRVDNMNRSLLVNSFFYYQSRGNIMGLFTAIRKSSGEIRTAFNVIDDSVRRRC